MRRALLIGVCLFASVSLAGDLDAARPLVEHMARGIPTTQPGDWVTWKISGGVGRTQYWRVGIVGEEKDAKGRDALWVDVEMGEHPAMRAPLLQSRLLIARDTQAEDPITRVFLAWGAERVQELAPDAVNLLTHPKAEQQEKDPDDTADASKVHIRTGKEQRLMTLAGTVTAIPVEARYGSVVLKRYWLSREIPILQLARMEMPRIDHTMEVREYGRGYVSRMILPTPDQPKIGIEKLQDTLSRPLPQAAPPPGGSHEP